MSKDDIEAARSMLIDIVEKGRFPDESFDIRHIERIEEFERTAPNKLRFSVLRHPHLFRHKTLGKASSAYAIEKRTFELHTDTGAVVPISEEGEDVRIDYEALAEYHIDLAMEAGIFDFDTLGSEAEVIKAVEDDIRDSGWDDLALRS